MRDFKFFLFTYLFLAVLGLHCCMVFSVVAARGAALQCRLLTAAASLVLSLGLWGIWGILASVAVAPGPQELGRTGLAAPGPVGSSWIRG